MIPNNRLRVEVVATQATDHELWLIERAPDALREEDRELATVLASGARTEMCNLKAKWDQLFKWEAR